MVDVPDGFDWPAGWRALPVPDGWLGLAGSAEVELARELAPGHPLHGATCRAVGFNADNPNEFLFVTDRPAVPLAFVHLTWRAGHDPSWPCTSGYPSWEAFQADWQTSEAE
jgi:hypothetical protein